MPLDSSDSPNNARISEESAHRLLARAAELDAHAGGELSIDQLREIALEAGIAASAFDAALRELEAHDHLAGDAKPAARAGGLVERLARHRILVAATILLGVACATPGDLVFMTLVVSTPIYAAYELWMARRNRPTNSRPTSAANDSGHGDFRTPDANPADRTTRHLLLRPAL
jgi:hypothetical protein